MQKLKSKHKNERDFIKEKIMLKKGIITEEEIRRLWYEKKNV